MELRIRDVSKTCPNGVQALTQISPMAGHIGRSRRQPEVAP